MIPSKKNLKEKSRSTGSTLLHIPSAPSAHEGEWIHFEALKYSCYNNASHARLHITLEVQTQDTVLHVDTSQGWHGCSCLRVHEFASSIIIEKDRRLSVVYHVMNTMLTLHHKTNKSIPSRFNQRAHLCIRKATYRYHLIQSTFRDDARFPG